MNLSLLEKSLRLLINTRVTYVVFGFYLLLVLVCFYSFVRIKPLEILLPTSKNKVSFFTDITDGGKSYLLSTTFTDSSVLMKYRLNKGFVTPYAGLTINDISDLADFSKYNKIYLKIRAKGLDNVYIHVATKDLNVKDKSHRLADRISAVNLSLDHGLFNKSIAFTQFETPTWWTHAIHQSINDFGPISWDQLRTVALVTGTSYTQDMDQELELISLRFYNDYAPFIRTSVVVALLGLCSLLVYYMYIARKSTRRSITIEYKPTLDHTKSKDDTQAVLHYIQEHYADSELNLAKVAKAVGVPERSVSKMISEQYQCNFRMYINNIRIAEAERLLKDSRLSVSEVGYKVGFNDPSSFSKTFKKITGRPPSSLL